MSRGRAVVTGAAGFIGSWTCGRLLDDGWQVVGVDCLTDYYDTAQKRGNVAGLAGRDGFTWQPLDLTVCPLEPLLDDVDVVIHLAGQPGVRASWGTSFSAYLEANVLVTQRLLEAARRRELRRFVYASSSSVYGKAERYPTKESDVPRPVSPYGVTKLAGEHMCTLYAASHGVPTVSLRYFTVFGPRQRPDMAMHKLMKAAYGGQAFPIYGDGSAIRDFTFIEDVVRANLLAVERPVSPGTVLNIGGGGRGTTLGEVIRMVEEITGKRVALTRLERMAGDPARTGADTTLAREVLGWTPVVDVASGLERQAEWHAAQAGVA